MSGALGSSFSVRRKHYLHINARAENALLETGGLQQTLARVERATIKGIYMSDSSSRAIATATVPGFVRNLGAFEEIYWLYNQLGAHGFAYAMEVDGPTIVDDWRSALDVLQRSQPFFSVSIEPNNGGVPFFRHVDGAPIPLRVVDGMSGPSWQEEMAREIFTAFAGDVGRSCGLP
jgi:hypothetical protein